MKRKHTFIVFLTTLLMISCSSDDGPGEEPNNPETPENFKFLATVKSEDNSSGDRTMDVIYDDDGLLDTYNWETFEYNSKNKIAKSLSTEISGESDYVDYTYENDRLHQLSYYYNGNHERDKTFNYDEAGNIISIIDNYDSIHDDSLYFSYDSEGNLLGMRFGDTGEVYSYEFDDNENPFYPLWAKFGLYRYYRSGLYMMLPMFFKHNPVKMYQDGVLRSEAVYTYDDEGYPLSCSFKKYSNSDGSVQSEGTIHFSYKD